MKQVLVMTTNKISYQAIDKKQKQKQKIKN